MLKIIQGNLIYWRALLLRINPPPEHGKWEFIGALHEYVNTNFKNKFHLEGNYSVVSRRMGSRSKSDDKFCRDGIIFERLLEDDPENTRNIFYCGRSWFDHRDYGTAAYWYQRLIDLGNKVWPQEMFVAMKEMAQCYLYMRCDKNMVVKLFLDACYFMPSRRAEALIHVIDIYMSNRDWENARKYAALCLNDPIPVGDLFVRSECYGEEIRKKYDKCGEKLWGKRSKRDEGRKFLIIGKPPPDLFKYICNRGSVKFKCEDLAEVERVFLFDYCLREHEYIISSGVEIVLYYMGRNADDIIAALDQTKTVIMDKNSDYGMYYRLRQISKGVIIRPCEKFKL